jgi:hypothetical protein
LLLLKKSAERQADALLMADGRAKILWKYVQLLCPYFWTHISPIQPFFFRFIFRYTLSFEQSKLLGRAVKATPLNG